MGIDAGQKEIGPIVCPTCGSVYTVGDPEDEAQHDQVHSGLMEKLKMPIWKTERIVGQFAAGRVVCVRPGDHSSHWKKVEEALTVVDRDLGFSEVGIRWPDKTKEDTGEALERMETKMDTEVGAAQGKEDTGEALE